MVDVVDLAPDVDNMSHAHEVPERLGGRASTRDQPELLLGGAAVLRLVAYLPDNQKSLLSTHQREHFDNRNGGNAEAYSSIRSWK